jgi:arginine decarboxylase-like protein
VGKVHLSEIISRVELYCFNIGGGLCCEWEKYTTRYNFTEMYFSHSLNNPPPILKWYSSTLDIKLYCFNIGGGLFSEWEKYTSVKLYLELSYTVLI